MNTESEKSSNSHWVSPQTRMPAKHEVMLVVTDPLSTDSGEKDLADAAGENWIGACLVQLDGKEDGIELALVFNMGNSCHLVPVVEGGQAMASRITSWTPWVQHKDSSLARFSPVPDQPSPKLEQGLLATFPSLLSEEDVMWIKSRGQMNLSS